MKQISNKEYAELMRNIPVVLGALPISQDIKLENAKRLLKKFVIKNK